MTETTHEQIPEAVRETRLRQLRDHLSARYGLGVATIEPSPRDGLVDQTQCLVIARGRTAADVLVAVSIAPDSGLYVLAAFTVTGWYEYGDPFQCAERDALQRAARWVFQFIPETPADTP
jgi:hypothetical protein